jgi:hypothetical protein
LMGRGKVGIFVTLYGGSYCESRRGS